VAIDKHGAPDGDDNGAHGEISGKPALASAGKNVTSGGPDGSGGPGAETEHGGRPAGGGGPGTAAAGERDERRGHGGRQGRVPVSGGAGSGADAAEGAPGGAENADSAEGPERPGSFEPYPQAPDPFSSAYQQGAPPYPPQAGDQAGDQAGGYLAQGMYGTVPAYPPFQSYGYDVDTETGYPPDVYGDYGEQSPVSGYGYAGAPTAEPLPGTGTSGDGYPAMAAPGYETGFPPLSPPERGGSQRGHEDRQQPAARNHAAGGAAPPGTVPGGGDMAGTAAAGSGQPGTVSREQAQQGGGARNGLRGEPLSPLPFPPAGAEQPRSEQVRETADSLTSEALLPGKRAVPASGWRRALYKASGGLVRVGESAAAQRRRELMWRARTPVAGGHHRVAVMSLKGGVGKTTTAVGLGSTLGMLRGDRVIAIDANPDRGTLSDKVRLETSATVRDLLNEREQIRRYADVRAFTSQALSRLEVLASDRDPAVSVAFSDEDYCEVAHLLERYYSICITDCGTGLLHSAMAGVLRLADQVILVSSPSVDGARSASATLDWLEAHDYGDLVRNAVVVLSTVRPRSKSTVDLERLEQHFATRCRAVTRIPYDSHLEEGAEVELDQLSPATADAYLELAATVGDGFAWPRRSMHHPA
jgi:MinD-like ATPase involved in chromosome partitioning or flagellar assembly